MLWFRYCSGNPDRSGDRGSVLGMVGPASVYYVREMHKLDLLLPSGYDSGCVSMVPADVWL